MEAASGASGGSDASILVDGPTSGAPAGGTSSSEVAAATPTTDGVVSSTSGAHESTAWIVHSCAIAAICIVWLGLGA